MGSERVGVRGPIKLVSRSLICREFFLSAVAYASVLMNSRFALPLFVFLDPDFFYNIICYYF